MIREAHEADIPAILSLGMAFAAESPRYRDSGFDADKVEQAIRGRLDEGGMFVAERDGKVVGMIAAFLGEQYFSRQLFVSDLAFFVAPEARGPPRMALRLIEAVAEWGRAHGAEEMISAVSSQIDDERACAVYERMGFERTGVSFRLPRGSPEPPATVSGSRQGARG